VKVLRLPGKRCRPVRGQPAIIFFHRDAARTKVRDLIAAYNREYKMA
jgi:hypothetical protein